MIAFTCHQEILTKSFSAFWLLKVLNLKPSISQSVLNFLGSTYQAPASPWSSSGRSRWLSLGGSHLVGLRHALQHQVLRPEMWKTQSQNLHFCNFCPANYGCNISDSTESAVDFIPKKTSQKFMVIFSFVESSRRCEKKTWELRYLGREESSW